MKILCFFQTKEEKTRQFIRENDTKENVLELYEEVADSCEGDVNICVQVIMERILSGDENDSMKLVTDIKSLYAVANELFRVFFEEIILIEVEECKQFTVDVRVDENIELLKSVTDDKTAKNIAYIQEIYHVPDLMDVLTAMKDIKEMTGDSATCTKFACFLMKYKCRQAGKVKLFYEIAYTSMAMRFVKDEYYTNKVLELAYNSEVLEAENLYYIWNQYKGCSFRNFIKSDETTGKLMDMYYEKSCDMFTDRYNKFIEEIPVEERNKDVVLVMTIQFLEPEGNHAPTKTVMERCETLIKMGKKVILVNTAEQYLDDGIIPLYKSIHAAVNYKYMNADKMNIGEYEIPYIQFDADDPMDERIKKIMSLIRDVKPYYILSVATGSMIADICAKMVPMAAMNLVFSSVPKTINGMRIVGRALTDEEKLHKEEKRYIESRFTFELKPQKRKYTRAEKGLPEDRFLMVVIGIRLDSDIDEEFLSFMEGMAKKGAYLVLAGVYNDYEKKIQNYESLRKNSTYIGYDDDMSALMEIVDLYVNPYRAGGGFSVIEAMDKGVPAVYFKTGDVYAAGGEKFAVDDYTSMEKVICRYMEDKAFYKEMSDAARIRAEEMTSSIRAMADIDKQICEYIEKIEFGVY